MSQIERELEHELDHDIGALPSLPDEQQQSLIEMQQIREKTVGPGMMRLPVKRVSDAANSPQWSIDVEHPTLGELRFFVEKPVHGWDRDSEMVQLLEWYGIHDENIYRLQCEEVFVLHAPDESPQSHGWVLREPPWHREARLESRTYRDRAREFAADRRPRLGTVGAYLSLFFGVLIFGGGAVYAGGSGFGVLFTALLGFLWATAIAIILYTRGEAA